MDAPQLVSVIIPYFNQGQRLVDAVSSVETQTYQHLEILVVDDGSLGIAAAQVLGRRTVRPLRILRHPMHAGPAAAKNSGTARSSGQLIAFLDADDMIANTFLESAVAAMNTNPGTELVYSGIRTFGGFNAPLDPRVSVPGLLSGEDPPRTFLCTRAFHESLSGHNANLRSAENSDYWLRAILAGTQPLKIDERLSLCRVGEGTRSADRDYPRRVVLELIEQQPDLYKRNLEAVLIEQKQKHLDYRALSSALRVETELLRQELTERHQAFSHDNESHNCDDAAAKPADFDTVPEAKTSIFKRWSSLFARQSANSKQSTTGFG